jgi:uncharacterized membrane-anchored protein
MTMRRNLWLATGAVALIQAAVLGWMIFDRARLLQNGQEIVLEVIPVDPRSLFQGDYVTLTYDISRVPAPDAHAVARGTDIYTTLSKGADGLWRPVRSSLTQPKATGPDEIVLKGRAKFSFAATDKTPAQIGVRYGIESYFVPEGEGKELEQLVRDRKLSAVVAVDDNGNAGIKGLMVDGKRVYEEPLL